MLEGDMEKKVTKNIIFTAPLDFFFRFRTDDEGRIRVNTLLPLPKPLDLTQPDFNEPNSKAPTDGSKIFILYPV